MTNPVLVEVLRGAVVECRHRGAVCVIDGDGKAVLEIGEVERPVFPRSAVKAIQALPLLESGAADALGLAGKEIALACASHSGAAAHVELARAMLKKAGLDETALECGAHWPSDHEETRRLTGAGDVPSALHNNCSGKHAGFLCTCLHLGFRHRGYVAHGHPVQELVREALERVTGAPHAVDLCGTDGCSIPTCAVPLRSLASGFARMATGAGLGPERAKAARRIMEDCMDNPLFVAGSGRMDTQIMEAAAGRIFAKTGAEGVYCGAVPELGLGIAVKCDDGAGRASEAMIAAALAKLFERDASLEPLLRSLRDYALFNWRGIEVGRIRPAGPLADRAQFT